MEIKQLEPGQFVDLFGTEVDNKSQTSKFGALEKNVDIFSSSTETTTQAPSTNDDTTKVPINDNTIIEGSLTDTTTKVITEADLFSDDKKPGRKPKYDFTDTSGYFEDRFKSGKFIAVEETGEDGTAKPFIPKSPEEFDEVIDIQVEYKLNEAKKELEKKIYESKSPAWQAIMKYSELTDDPSEVVPFIQGIRNIQSVSEIDENTQEGAEQIVRTRLLQRGDTEDVISEQIDVLKGADKLISTATKYKPLIINDEKHNLHLMNQQKQQEDREYQNLVLDIRQSAVSAIDTPLFGKIKLKQDEKAAVYDLIGQPNELTRGYGIYSVIDNLFERRDFETLKQVALLLSKKESFLSYISSNASDKTAANLQLKLRSVVDNRGSSTHDDPTEDRKVVERNIYKQQTSHFGRQ